MDNLHLFELINAAPGLGPIRLGLAMLLAQWVIYLIPLLMVTAWVRGDHQVRRELVQMLTALLIAVALAQIVRVVWPQPRPFTLHLGTQYLAHGNDPGLPSGHATVIWTLALAALHTQRIAVCGFPLLAAGLAVGWSRIYLGVHFPLDIAAALPVALAASLAARAIRHPTRLVGIKVLSLYDRLSARVPAKVGTERKA